MFYIMGIYFVFAILIFFFFLATPKEIGLEIKDEEEENDYEEAEAIEEQRIGFCEALLAPNVLLYGFCFFTVKFAVYSLMLWLPLFLS